MDLSLAESINGWTARHDAVASICEFLARDGVVLILAIVAVLFLAPRPYASLAGRRGASAAGFSALLALGVAQLISNAVDRPRPFADHPQTIHLLVRHSTDPGFPSDHTTGAFAIAVAIALRHRLGGALALVLAAAIGLSRVAVGAHYPGDVLGGALLGAAAALVLWVGPLRRMTDRVADAVAALYDRALHALTGGRLGAAAAA